MKIAVIGGSGFVGTKLIDLLIQEPDNEIRNIDKVTSVKHPAITHIGNVLDCSVLVAGLAGIELVILLAAEHRDDVTPVSKYYDVNVNGMKNTLNAMEANGIKRIIFTSSVAVYGLD
ncbi:MAG: NAD-dependent epimerase/dehydratase family protein, partial [Sphingobacterium sp.]|nr:NAD-dependent epimerase/dehydratase family protein [Sphingobacterium sp.]